MLTFLPLLLVAAPNPLELTHLPGVAVVVDSQHRDRWGLDVCRPEFVLDGATDHPYQHAWASDNWEVTHTLVLVFPQPVDLQRVVVTWATVSAAPTAPRACRLDTCRGGQWQTGPDQHPSGPTLTVDGPAVGVEALRLVQPPDGAAPNADRRLWVAEVQAFGRLSQAAGAVDVARRRAQFTAELAAQRQREDDARTAPIVAVAMSPLKTQGFQSLISRADVARGRHNVATRPWAKAYADSVVKAADWWVGQTDERLYDLIPAGNPRALCPSFEHGCPLHGGARSNYTATLEQPYQWRCRQGGEAWYDGAVVKNPGTGQDVVVHDDGHGWLAPPGFPQAGRRYYFVAAYRYFVLGKLFNGPYEPDGGSAYQGPPAIVALSVAYAITGERKYAHKAALLLARLAQVYRRYDGCVEGPSQRQDGYVGQGFEPSLAQNLALACDLVWDELAADTELRRFLTARSGADPGDLAAHVQRNLLGYVYEWLHRLMPYFDGDFIMYEMTSLAALAHCLNNPALAQEALDSDVGLRVLLTNSWFRDGKFIYDSTGYNVGNAETPLAIAEWLHGLTAPPAFAQPLDLYHDPRYRLRMLYDFLRYVDCDGRPPQIGDVGGSRGPVLRFAPDWSLRHERALLRLPEDRAYYAQSLLAASQGQPEAFRLGHADWWLLFHAADPPAGAAAEAPVSASHTFDDGGIAILRAGRHAATRLHVPLTYSKGSYAHGHADKLALNLLRYGFDFSADLGYPTTWTDLKGSGWETDTASHCTVELDEQRQTMYAYGRLHFFAAHPAVDVVEASCEGAYPRSTLYRRTVALVRDEAGEPLYVADLFRLAGATTRDWLFHSLGTPDRLTIDRPEPAAAWTRQPTGSLAGVEVAPMSKPGYGFLFNVERAPCPGVVHATWSPGGGTSQPDRYLLTRQTFGQATVEFTLTRTGEASGPQERAVFCFTMDPANLSARRVIMLPADSLPVGRAVAVKILLQGAQATMTIDGRATGRVDTVGAPAASGAVGFLHYYNYGWEYRNLQVTPGTGPPVRFDFSRPLDPRDWARLDPTYRAGDGALHVRDAQPVGCHLFAAGAPGRQVLRAAAEGYGLRGHSPLEGHLILRDKLADPAAGSAFAAVLEPYQDERRLRGLEPLTITPAGDGPLAAADGLALKVTAGERVDYVLSTLADHGVRTVVADGRTIRFRGRFGLVTTRAGQVTSLALVGTGRLECDGQRVEQVDWHATVVAVDVATNSVLLRGDRPAMDLVGRKLILNHPGYVTPSVYTIEAVEPQPDGLLRTKLDLPLTIARGVIGSVDPAALAFATQTPVMKLRVNAGLFNAKPVIALPAGPPRRLKSAVESAFVLEDAAALHEFRAGGEYAVVDLGVGDTAEVVADGHWAR